MNGGTLEALDDGGLLAAVAEGDRAAFRALYDRHAPWLVLRLARRCADPEAVDEVLQDTFLAVWRSAHRYRTQGEVTAWIWPPPAARLVEPTMEDGYLLVLGPRAIGEEAA